MVMLRPSSRGTASTLPTVADVLGHLVEDLLAQLGVEDLPAPEHDRDLHLVALGQELADLAGLGVEVPLADLRAGTSSP